MHLFAGQDVFVVEDFSSQMSGERSTYHWCRHLQGSEGG